MTDIYPQAYEYAMLNEGKGKLTNHALDPGKQTYSGISRVHHPGWRGWSLIDYYLKEGLEIDHARLEPMVREFYKYVFWYPIAGDQLAELSPAIAIKIFDTGINVNTMRPAEWLQMALNLLNRNKKLYPDILVDGDIGSITLGTLRIALSQRPPTKEVTERRIIKIISSRYSDLWFDRMQKFPEREEFRGIWDRV